jgi:hypothetical protein
MCSAKPESVRRCYRCKGSGKIKIDVMGDAKSAPPYTGTTFTTARTPAACGSLLYAIAVIATAMVSSIEERPCLKSRAFRSLAAAQGSSRLRRYPLGSEAK